MCDQAFAFPEKSGENREYTICLSELHAKSCDAT